MISLILYQSAKSKINITDMIESISWSSDINTLPRKIDVSLQNTNNLDKLLVNYSVGNLVIAYDNGIEIFRGYIFTRTRNHDGKESFTAYDELIYATKNEDTILVRNKTASDVIISLCKKFGIGIGSITSTSYKISKLLIESQALNEIFQQCLDETSKHTGKLYRFSSRRGKVYLVPRTGASKTTININDIISGSNEMSIEELRNQVTVTKGALDYTPPKKTAKGKKPAKTTDNHFISYTVEDSSLISKYGKMQHIEQADDKATKAQMKSQAEKLLSQLKGPTVTMSVDFIGNSSCITGNLIDIHDDLTGISGRYYITSDSHTWSSGTHKMTLQLSKKLQ